MSFKHITVGGGCFWCFEAVFKRIQGVNKVISGYAGGDPIRISHKEVSTGTTGHAEVVQIEYDEKIISTKKILLIFFALHNPTELNKQQKQYRSVIFYHNDEQKQMADDLMKFMLKNKNYGENVEILTTIKKYEIFHPANIEHQEYFEKNPNQTFCKVILKPKLDKIKAEFKEFI